MKKYRIAVVGTGSVCLSMATLWAQHNNVVAYGDADFVVIAAPTV